MQPTGQSGGAGDDEPDRPRRDGSRSPRERLRDAARVGDLTYRAARRIAVLVIGTTLALLGLVLLVTPGPGLLFLALALGVLAVEFTWARVWLHRLRETASGVGHRLGGDGSGSEPPRREGDAGPPADRPSR